MLEWGVPGHGAAQGCPVAASTGPPLTHPWSSLSSREAAAFLGAPGQLLAACDPRAPHMADVMAACPVPFPFEILVRRMGQGSLVTRGPHTLEPLFFPNPSRPIFVLKGDDPVKLGLTPDVLGTDQLLPLLPAQMDSVMLVGQRATLRAAWLPQSPLSPKTIAS